MNKIISYLGFALKSNNLIAGQTALKKTTKKQEITILDFGCGKSYLTFLVYYYFVKIKQIKAKIIGYDIKKDVVENCNKIAKKYNYDGLEFILSDVKKDQLFEGKVDMVITLHACDTATDFALDFAIKNRVKHIFSVPCCQHEVNMSIKKAGDFDILLNDGLIKERFSALLTDAVRVEILRAKGYSVDVIEFVDFAHSPKNLMIRAKFNSVIKSLDDIKILKNEQTNRPVEYINHSILGDMPLSTYGDGIKKVLSIANAIAQSANGILLIDEVETAIHSKYYDKIFSFLTMASKHFNVQLFLTTHSIEAIDSLLATQNYDTQDTTDDISVITIKKAEDKTYSRVLSGRQVTKNRESFGFEVRI